MSTVGAVPIRVFLVDDHQMFAASLVRVFRDVADVEVVGVAASLAAARTSIRSAAPAVVIMDYLLPDGDGVSGTRELREIVPEANVLLLTGDDDPRLVGRAIEAGCMGFLTKDRAITELLDAVYTLAAGDAFVPGDLLTHLLPTLGRSQQGLGSDLTPRELEVLRLAAAGMANSSIAATLYLSVNTIRNHVQNAITKLGAHSKLEAVTLALRERLIDLTPP